MPSIPELVQKDGCRPQLKYFTIAGEGRCEILGGTCEIRRRKTLKLLDAGGMPLKVHGCEESHKPWAPKHEDSTLPHNGSSPGAALAGSQKSKANLWKDLFHMLIESTSNHLNNV